MLADGTRAPFAFFQKTDAGTITNRFSQDMDLIDLNLPMQAIQFTTGNPPPQETKLDLLLTSPS